MKKLKTLVAALTAATMVLTMTGCNEEEPVAATSTTSGSTVGSVEMDDEAVNEAAKALKDQLSYPDLKVTKRIKWMSWWPMDETGGAAVLFKEVYGIPETGDDPAEEGRVFEYQSVAYPDRLDKLGAAISADESPDIYPFEMKDFPYGVLYNRYQPLDDIIDFNDKNWSKFNDLNDQFVLNGKHYVGFFEYSIADFMWYRKSNIEAIGADDPQELFLQGKWDWDVFLDISRKWQQTGTTDSPKYATDGFWVDTGLLLSTGVPMVGSDGTKIVSNLRTPEVERAMTGIIVTLEKENLRYPRHELNSYDPNYAEWANGNTLFFCEGSYRYEETLQTFKKKYKWADDEIKYVPYPKDPKADKHYVELKVYNEMWVKGSKNAEGVKAWMDCKIVAAQDKALHDASNQKMINNPKQNYTKEILDFMDLLYGWKGESPVTPIVDYSMGLGPNVSAETTAGPIKSLINLPYLTGESYVQLREENEPLILDGINQINAQL